MITTIEVNKQSVFQLLQGGKEHPFVIPEYQRPYAWGEDEIDTLFTDLWDFSTTSGGADCDGTYFLGSVVSFMNEKGEQEIIDGQQRITSLFLLLRAIYTKLANEKNNREAANFIRQIEPAIWRTDKLTGDADYSRILLNSRVVNNEGNDILLNILQSGTADAKSTDNYSRNYRHFQKLLDDVAQETPVSIYNFIYAILHQAIILPISAGNQDTALTIFSTLNDRGMPLSDADIFKATIYNKLAAEEKGVFIDQWKELDERSAEVGESVQKLFYYYMFALRARNMDSKSTIPGIRKYYFENKTQRLFAPELMDSLRTLLNLWRVVNRRYDVDESWVENAQILQALDILSSYPNEFWKYPVIIYYLSHREAPDFAQGFLLFLHRLIAELLTKYLITSTINAVKGDILKLNVEIINSRHPAFDFKPADVADIASRIKTPHRNAIRMLLKILAYQEQDELLPPTWEIEHIFPQRWQSSYFTATPDMNVREIIEHLGNKLPLEKQQNIIASNGYFTVKKQAYQKSQIRMVQNLALSNIVEWRINDIIESDQRRAEKIMGILQLWESEYEGKRAHAASQPSDEELRQIAVFRANGWI